VSNGGAKIRSISPTGVVFGGVGDDLSDPVDIFRETIVDFGGISIHFRSTGISGCFGSVVMHVSFLCRQFRHVG